MAKKNKRQVSRQFATSAGSASVSARNEFNPDYTHIKRDLGRIGVLAGAFFALLIALSFFLK